MELMFVVAKLPAFVYCIFLFSEVSFQKKKMYIGHENGIKKRTNSGVSKLVLGCIHENIW